MCGPHCTANIQAETSSAAVILQDKYLQDDWCSWVCIGKVCNMHIEREFARIRKSVPRASPSVERMCVACCLAQARHCHQSAGGTPLGNITRKALLQDGVPIAARPHRAKAMPGRCRGHVHFLKLQTASAQQQLGRELKKGGVAFHPFEGVCILS